MFMSDKGIKLHQIDQIDKYHNALGFKILQIIPYRQG